MCEPTTIAMIGMTALTTAMSAQGQSSAIKSQNKANQIQADADQAAAVANYDQLERRRQQEEAGASQSLIENQIDALQATETAQVAAGESGVSGISVNALLRDMYGKEARFNDSVAQNFENTSFEIDNQKDNVHRGVVSSINSLPKPQAVDYGGLAMGAARGGFAAYQNHLKIQAATT